MWLNVALCGLILLLSWILFIIYRDRSNLPAPQILLHENIKEAVYLGDPPRQVFFILLTSRLSHRFFRLLSEHSFAGEALEEKVSALIEEELDLFRKLGVTEAMRLEAKDFQELARIIILDFQETNYADPS